MQLGPSYEDWRPQTARPGRINLDEVQTSFKGAKSVSDFENRVNQIYEGDGLVLIRAEQTDTALVLGGWEDLNGNSSIDDAQDEKLFTITEKEDKSHDMRGHHANSYYHSTWGPGSFSSPTCSCHPSPVPDTYMPPTPAMPGDVKRESLVLSECIRVSTAGK